MTTQHFLVIFISLTISSLLFSKQASRKGKDYALIFAIQDYDYWTDLKSPIRDAEALAKDLKGTYGFEVEIVKNPTKNKIYRTLGTYRSKLYGKQDQLFIFFSGHGEFNDDTEEGFLIPREGQLNDPFQESYLPHSRLEKAINTIPCQHILLAIDACYSGTFDESIAQMKGSRTNFSRKKDQLPTHFFVEQLLKHKSRLYFTSGGKERTPDGLKHSPFVTQFLTALRDLEGVGIDGIISYTEILSHLEKARPLPKAGQFGDNEIGSSFVFVSRQALPPMPKRKEVNNKPEDRTLSFDEMEQLRVKASALSFRNFDVNGVKPRKNGKFVKKNCAKNIWNVAIQFEVMPSEFITTGSNQLVFRIKGPDGEVLRSNDDCVPFLNKNLNRTTCSTFTHDLIYEGDTMSVRMHWPLNLKEQEHKFSPGAYEIEIYNKGYLLNETNFLLKECSTTGVIDTLRN